MFHININNLVYLEFLIFPLLFLIISIPYFIFSIIFTFITVKIVKPSKKKSILIFFIFFVLSIAGHNLYIDYRAKVDRVRYDACEKLYKNKENWKYVSIKEFISTWKPDYTYSSGIGTVYGYSHVKSHSGMFAVGGSNAQCEIYADPSGMIIEIISQMEA
ncbi:MAG: hypothetical protein Q7S61_06020 [bacterium]|nr:hypothetical protein [bacterium]